MAANFRINDVVKLNVAPPQGPINKIQFNDDGEIEYLVNWTDTNGDEQARWFKESELMLA